MSSWTVIDICKEMADITTLLDVRMPFASANIDGYMAMAGAMISSITHKIKSIQPLSASQAVELYRAASAMKLCDELKVTLTKAIDEGVSCQPHEGAVPASLVPQSNIYMYNYLTQSDWNTLNSTDCTYFAAINVLATRLRLVGVKSLKEDTKKWCTALLVHCFMQKSGKMPPYRMIYQLSHDLSQAHASCITQTPATLSCPNRYPDKPQSLGKSWLEVAYSASDPPVEVQLHNLGNLVQHHTPIRATSKLLADTPMFEARKQSQPLELGNMQQLADSITKLSTAFSTGFQNHDVRALPSPQQCLPPSFQPSLPLALPPVPEISAPVPEANLASAAQSFKPTPRLRMHLSKPPCSSDQDLATKDSAECATKCLKSLEAYETASYNDLVSKKKPAKACKAEVLKRPAASSTDPEAELLLGCPRCRGNINGCSTCRSSNYNGVRLHGKTAWEAHCKKQKVKHTANGK